ncbi:MAG: hypothetical protein V3S66_10575, partial [Desulfobacterales bacterium]
RIDRRQSPESESAEGRLSLIWHLDLWYRAGTRAFTGSEFTVQGWLIGILPHRPLTLNPEPINFESEQLLR